MYRLTSESCVQAFLPSMERRNSTQSKNRHLLRKPRSHESSFERVSESWRRSTSPHRRNAFRLTGASSSPSKSEVIGTYDPASADWASENGSDTSPTQNKRVAANRPLRSLIWFSKNMLSPWRGGARNFLKSAVSGTSLFVP